MRVSCVVDNKNGQIALDHVQSIDKIRLVKKLATLDLPTQTKLIKTLLAMFDF